MSENNSCKDCRAHSGIDTSIEKLEDSVKKLWGKWDWMIKMVVGVFVTLCLNLSVLVFVAFKIGK